MSDPPKLTLVLRELFARRATGVLTVHTPDATGEIRLRQGEIEDVLLGRAHGKKALVRMLAASDITLAFRDSEEFWERRIAAATDELMMAATAARDALLTARTAYGEHTDAFAMGAEIPETRGPALTPSARALWLRLRAPVAYADVLDNAPEDDAELVAALGELEAAGALRWLRPEGERQAITTSHWSPSPFAERLGPRTRLVFAGTPHRLAVLMHSSLYLDEVTRPLHAAPLVPMPHVAASAVLHRVIVDLVACPLVPVYAPLWPLAVSGAALVVRLDEAAPALLEAAAEISSARVVAAEALVGTLDEASVGAVGALLRAAFDEAAS